MGGDDAERETSGASAHAAPGVSAATAPRPRPLDRSPLWIALVYATLGILWIVGSDAAVLAVVGDEQALTRLQTYKGWFFVVASAGLIYALVRRRVNALQAAIEARETTTRDRMRLVAILEATSDLVCVITPDHRLRYLNAAGRQLLGIAPDEPLDRFDARQFLPEHERLPQSAGPAQGSGQDVIQLERELHRVDGSSVLVSQVLLMHRSLDGRSEYISTIARDISEQRRQEHALRQAQKMEAVGQLAGGVAHDFNNLLTVIVNCGESLVQSLPAGDERHEEAVDIVQASQRAARLTRQLLAFSRQQVMESRTIDLNVVVRSLVVMLRRLLSEQVKLVEQLDGESPHVFLDASQLEQVLVNLVVNARDAMPNGGTITIRTSNRRSRPAHMVVLEVQDTGVGMDESTRARVFEPFFTTKKPGQGTGLGLATAAGIVAQSGGDISVASTPGHGTTFRLEFPAVARPIVPAPARTDTVPTPWDGSRAISSSGERLRVLVVEDQDEVRHLTARMLTADGYDVVPVRSAEEALDVLGDGRDVALLLTDVEMPGASGRSLAGSLAHDDRRIPVLFMSGYSNDSLRLRGALPPNAAFLAKPFTHDSLRAAIRKALIG